jgi:type I restriction enzyme S subunit
VADWPTRPFADLLDVPLRNGLTKPKRVRGEGALFVNMGELFAYDRIGDIPMDRVPLTDREREGSLLQPADLLFARQSLVAEGAGKCSIFLGSLESVAFESHLIRARVDRESTDPFFLYYYFQSPAGRAQVSTIVNQVAAAGIRGSDLGRLRVPAPDRDEQIEIGLMLNAFDEKIEINAEICLQLERLLRARLNEAFPNPERVENGSGYRICTFDDIAECVKEGQNASDADPNEPYLGLKAMPRNSTVLGHWDKRSKASGRTSTFRRGDVLFGKLRPYFKKVGVAPVDGSCSAEILVLRPKSDEDFAGVIAVAASQRFIDFADSVSKGAKMPRAEWKDIRSCPIAIPSDDRCRELTREARLVYDAIAERVHESHQLLRARDAIMAKTFTGADA